MVKKVQSGKQKKQVIGKKPVRWTIDLSIPAQDDLINPQHFEEFLKQRIKVKGKAGNLGKHINVNLEDQNLQVNVRECEFKKRYLKYLTKKYLKKQGIRDLLRVVAHDKGSYTVKYFAIAQEAAQNEEEQ
eukprot:gb/GECH01011147.1/.p1 GENE.gb/GECH01011147.1/~~gb/GECH01011147.1/.p1  ORF type:complete len:130 (+),score=25.86 gb/GECH01011147.1/:1-390(+)